jgi:hypothetical protein
VENTKFRPSQTTQILTLSNKAVLTKKYEIYTTYADSSKNKRLSRFRHAPSTRVKLLVTLYTYTGDDLGATYTPQQTMFKLWAPTSSAVASIFLITAHHQP